ncbi:hypothetical protein ACIRSS_25575 [Amycolatopsis sp. NPDC101161]|uniref:hypothetical protein n=1 Tax=Amycolatopsis sp. NPDC101161 TaxID=3363940 RepID=UPI0037F72527
MTSSPVASRARVTGARPSGAPRPPILVATHPGSTEFRSTPGHRRATPKATRMSKSLLSLQAWAPVPAPGRPLRIRQE